MTPAHPDGPRAPAGWLYAFLLFQFACQAALVVEALADLRTVFRFGTFASSLLMLAAVPGRSARYPLQWPAAVVIAITTLGLLHPRLNSAVAGVAQVAMYVAIWGPVFWVGRFALTPEVLRRVVLLLWAFHTLSAVVGVLQVYDPGRFAPDPKFVRQQLGEYAEGLQFTLTDGRQVWRPFGLTSTPGGASMSGAFAALVGLSLAVSRGGPLLRAAGVASAAVGMFCVYICQVRATLIVTGVGAVGMAVVLAARGRGGQAAGLTGLAAAVALGGFVWATAVGSDAVTRRLETLTEDSPGGVYYTSRGQMLEATFATDLPAYPLGAGPGRWGMMASYFGDPLNPDSPMLWAEIQPAAWVYDGGLLLLVAGYAAVVGACGLAVRTALRARSGRVADAAAVVAAFDLGVLANTFSYPVFISQTGMIFWLLNAACWAADRGNGPQPPAGGG